MLASYYWTEEAYRLHPETMKVVVLDTSMLRRTPDKAFYQKALDAMHFSKVKWHAVEDYTKDFNDTLSYTVPLFEYHGRWSSIVQTDFKKEDFKTIDCVRGYNFAGGRYFTAGNYTDLAVPSYYVDSTAKPSSLDESSLYYLKKLISFCSDHNLKLVLTKTPVVSSWPSADHNAVQAIADQYGLEFLDFNYEPLIDEMGYNHAIDSADGGHMNYYGAHKLTAWFGKYLTQSCGVPDVRSDSRYDFMKKELSDYKSYIGKMVDQRQITDPVEYIKSFSSDPDNTVFIMAKDDAASALTQEQRDAFKKMGLKKLSALTFRNSYYAVINSGKVIKEGTDVWTEDATAPKANPDDGWMPNDLEGAKLQKKLDDPPETLTISCKGKLSDGTQYVVTSGGLDYGNTASCLLNGTEAAMNSRGLNIVVYNRETDAVVDSTVFDTCASPARDPDNVVTALNKALADKVPYDSLSADEQKLYSYNKICRQNKERASLNQKIGTDGAFQFIEAYSKRPNTMIFISAMDDASTALDDKARNAFNGIGLNVLSQTEPKDSYIGVIENGKVIYEKKDHGKSPITHGDTDIGYAVTSGGTDSGNISSVKIYGAEASTAAKGLNIVVCNKKAMQVIDARNFDTGSTGTNPARIDFKWEDEE